MTPDSPVVIGPYELLATLGSGGFGSVHKARHVHLGRVDAVKVLRPGALQDDGDRERFDREGAAMARLRHDHIVRVYTSGVDKGWPYIAMELVEGADLCQHLAARGPLSIAEAVRLGEEMASALAHVHERDILHRDVKTSNVLRRSADGRFFLTDFGTAFQDHLSRLTKKKEVLGTEVYLSPERRTGDAEPRSDLYALGVVLFEALTGRVPFEGEGEALYRRIVAEPAPRVQRLREEVPAWLDETIDACLAKRVEERPASAEALARALRQQRRVAVPRADRPPTRPIPQPASGADSSASGPAPVGSAPVGPAPGSTVTVADRPPTRPVPVAERQRPLAVAEPEPVRQRPLAPAPPPSREAAVRPVAAMPQAVPRRNGSSTLLWVIALLAALVIVVAGLYIADNMLRQPGYAPEPVEVYDEGAVMDVLDDAPAELEDDTFVESRIEDDAMVEEPEPALEELPETATADTPGDGEIIDVPAEIESEDAEFPGGAQPGRGVW